MIIQDLSVLRANNAPATMEEAQRIIKKLEEELKASQAPGVGYIFGYATGDYAGLCCISWLSDA